MISIEKRPFQRQRKLSCLMKVNENELFLGPSFIKRINSMNFCFLMCWSLYFLLPCLQGELLSPCRCNGSVRCTHQPCLIRWISERGSWSCELCYFKYQVLAISTKNPLQVKSQPQTAKYLGQSKALASGSIYRLLQAKQDDAFSLCF